VSAVVLDYGNVLVAWEAMAAVAGRVSQADWDDFCQGADFDALNARSDLGEPFEDILADLAATHPRRPDWVEILSTYRANFPDSLTGPVPGTLGVVDDLLAAGVPLYLLSNFDAPTFPAARAMVPQLERFRGLMVSGQERQVKPSPVIFRRLLERYGLIAAFTLFVDDSPANIRGARAVGLRTHHFTGAGRLRADLIERGLLPRP
jgi:HAD hydrolase, family IA, variant 3